MDRATQVNSPCPASGSSLPQHSFWSEDYGRYEPSAALSEDVVADVAIIGAGFTGLSAALKLRQLDPSLRVVVLEQEAVGFGASGRNSGWVWPNFSSYEHIRSRWGRDVLRLSYNYAHQAYQYVKELVEGHSLDSEYREVGLLRPSVSAEYEPDRLAYVRLCEEMGRAHRLTEIPHAALREEFRSPLFHEALWDEELALIQPVKHARALCGLARSSGAVVYEQTPVFHVSEEPKRILLETPKGNVSADRIVIATGAYTHLLDGLGQYRLSRHQHPVFVYNTVTRPLSDSEWKSVGWRRRNAIYTFGPFSHFGHPTGDGRLHWCSDRFVGVPAGLAMNQEYLAGYRRTLEQETEMFFPSLAGVPSTHHWGGAVSATIDQIFHLGPLDRRGRIYISFGDNGNGVALAHLNGRVIAERMLGVRSDASDVWMLARKPSLWPSHGFASMAIRAYLAVAGWSNRRRARNCNFPVQG
jgi:glycine/D-amino acid oxidase-like deaminating enzyme